jgi:hypothetical protein
VLKPVDLLGRLFLLIQKRKQCEGLMAASIAFLFIISLEKLVIGLVFDRNHLGATSDPLNDWR